MVKSKIKAAMKAAEKKGWQIVHSCWVNEARMVCCPISSVLIAEDLDPVTAISIATEAAAILGTAGCNITAFWFGWDGCSYHPPSTVEREYYELGREMALEHFG